MQTERKKGVLLAVAQQWAWPLPNGFAVRTIEVLRQLSREWDIVLVAPSSVGQPPQPEPINVLSRISIPEQELVWGGVPTSSPEEEFKATVEAIERYGPEVLLVWGGFEIVEMLKGMKHPPIVFDLIDSWTLTFWRDRGGMGGLAAKLRNLKNVLQNAFEERRLARSVDTVLLVGESDATTLRMISGTENVRVVPNGAPDLPLRSREELTEHPSIVFSGVLEYPPNIDACTYFVREVFPHVKMQLPRCSFRIVGRRPVQEVLDLEREDGVQVVGDVPDMFAELRRSWVSVAPMRRGAGIKNKVLEAWAVGLPVFLSSIAANGLSLPETGCEMVHDEPHTLARSLVKALSAKEELLRIGETSRAHIREYQGWNTVGNTLLGIVDEAAERGRVTHDGA